MPNINFLVTGGAGFIGSNLVKQLIKDPNNFVVVVDDLSTGKKENIPESKHNNLKFIIVNVNKHSEISSVFYKFDFKYVFHYAAVVGVLRTQSNPLKVLEDLEGIKNILYLSKNTGVEKVIYSSSSEVYGEPFEFPQSETTTPLNSRIPYAVVKNVGEVYLKSFKKMYNLNYNIFRFFNTYGHEQSNHFVITKFINLALKNKDISIYGDGAQTRTFCFVKDNITASLRAVFNNNYNNSVINIGSNSEIKIIDLAKIIVQLTNSKSKIINQAPLKEGDMRRRLPKVEIMKRLLESEFIDLKTGIQMIISKKKVE